MATTTIVVEVPEEPNAFGVRKSLEKIVRNAEKLGLPAPTWTEEPITKPLQPSIVNGQAPWLLQLGFTGFPEPWVRFTITGEAPRVNGYTLVAQLDHKSVPGETLIRQVPGSNEDLSGFLGTRGKRCDHCHRAVWRNETLIFRGENGDLIEIGRNCAADFLRDSRIEGMINIWSGLCTAGTTDEIPEPRYRQILWTGEFIRLVLWVYRNHGWKSRASCEPGERSTGDRVVSMLLDPQYGKNNPVPSEENPLPALEDTQAFWEFLKSLPDTSDYTRNIRLIASVGTVALTNATFLASGVCLYHKHLEASAKPQIEQAPAVHFPAEPGTRVKKPVSVTVERAIVLEGFYGPTTILVFRTLNNEVLTWKASGAHEYKPGESLTLKAFTIKAHSDYRGRAQTEIQRATVD